jgi:hypothetical protein
MAKRTAAPPAFRLELGTRPRADIFPPPQRELPIHAAPVAPDGVRPAWWFVAAHGGSGAGLLARMSWQDFEHVSQTSPGAPSQPYGVSCGVAWPNPAFEPTGRAIVVCQTTMRGLGWARDAAAQYLAGRAPAGLHLLGLVTIADQPGHLPRPITAAKNLVAGAYARTWHVPYVPDYRLLTGLAEEQCPPIHPAVEDVLAAIRSIV